MNMQSKQSTRLKSRTQRIRKSQCSFSEEFRHQTASTPEDFLRQIWLPFHNPYLVGHPGAVVLTDCGAECEFDWSNIVPIRRLRLIREGLGLSLGPLSVNVLKPNGIPGTAIVVSGDQAPRLLMAASKIAQFWRIEE